MTNSEREFYNLLGGLSEVESTELTALLQATPLHRKLSPKLHSWLIQRLTEPSNTELDHRKWTSADLVSGLTLALVLKRGSVTERMAELSDVLTEVLATTTGARLLQLTKAHVRCN